MPAKLGLLYLTELQKLTQSSRMDLGSWMWNPKRTQDQDDDNSWEVKAFEEDTGNIMGMTWPPRSYSCTFCRREFRSAQALGGHMNVHRRDRARLHRTQPTSQLVPGGSNIINNHPDYINPLSNLTPNFITAQEFSAMNNGMCLVYQFPQHTSTNMNACPINSSPSTFFSVSPYNNYQIASPDNMVNASNYDSCYHNKWPEESNVSMEYSYKDNANCEELDLELRL